MGKQPLTQEEVDALLKGLFDDEIETEAAEKTEAEGVVPYDLFSQDHILHGYMPTMEVVNQTFARESTASWSRFVGSTVQVFVESFELLKYREFVRKLPDRTSLHVYETEPLRGSCLLFFDAKLICLVLDILFGGSGRLPVEMRGRDFTTMENRLIQRLLGMCFQDLEKAWSFWGKMSFRLRRSETNPRFVNIVAPTEIVMSSVFRMDLDSDQAVMGCCVPYSTIDSILGGR